MVDHLILRIKILEKEKGENDYNMKVSAEGEPQDLTNDETTENVEIYENNENEEISINYVSTEKGVTEMMLWLITFLLIMLLLK